MRLAFGFFCLCEMRQVHEVFKVVRVALGIGKSVKRGTLICLLAISQLEDPGMSTAR